MAAWGFFGKGMNCKLGWRAHCSMPLPSICANIIILGIVCIVVSEFELAAFC